MLSTPGDGHREGVRVGDPGGDAAAPVLLAAGQQAIGPGGPFRRVELGRILQVSHSSPAHLLGDPAFVADVGVAAALVEGGEQALHLGRAVPRRCQPRPFGLTCVKVGRRVRGADLRQPGPPRLEPPHDLQARTKPQLGGVLAAAPQLAALTVRGSTLRPAAVVGLVRAIPKLAHTPSISSSERYADSSSQLTLPPQDRAVP